MTIKTDNTARGIVLLQHLFGFENSTGVFKFENCVKLYWSMVQERRSI